VETHCKQIAEYVVKTLEKIFRQCICRRCSLSLPVKFHTLQLSVTVPRHAGREHLPYKMATATIADRTLSLTHHVQLRHWKEAKKWLTKCQLLLLLTKRAHCEAIVVMETIFRPINGAHRTVMSLICINAMHIVISL